MIERFPQEISFVFLSFLIKKEEEHNLGSYFIYLFFRLSPNALLFLYKMKEQSALLLTLFLIFILIS